MPDSQEQSGEVTFHPDAPPEFEHDTGQSFTLHGERAWFVVGRFWAYDVDEEDPYWPIHAYHKQYALGRVEALGGVDQLVSEADLKEQYEPISDERAKEIDL